jgi:hypothetical protein
MIIKEIIFHANLKIIFNYVSWKSLIVNQSVYQFNVKNFHVNFHGK